ncbi:DNA-binding response regulator [Streptomyces alfalfae]|uniref:DNA-binding response regulator n=1 Tax=Streptomyces alfalfae TaxID=1642299 RepID=A0A1P8TPN1_9ACTN|nr:MULTISPECIES: response regulator transcription factor [Streptomyces]AYA21492.1 DNA-binding response regulator [Streptomyces fradiae]APY89620.1 DNA-binding response regulator [Streptomyces alfalfae]KUL51191.1 two-component system response regulator [Streptomyces sp. NRRL S-1521]QQC87937.1 response regulator transcription factor [Streptomyces alfalfae]QUI30339.1 response regulator transcription factor [Streptomyces alfalfae]
MTAPPPHRRPVRVLLVEDHDMVAEAICLALERSPDLRIVGRAASVASALADAERYEPDVVLMDRRLPDGDGVGAIPGLLALIPDVRVLVLAGEGSAGVAARVAETGGAGLILKARGLRELEDAVRRVAAGEVVFGQDLLGDVLGRLSGRAPRPGANLTPRERQALRLLGEGHTTAELSELLGVALNTGRNHVQRVLEKLGARSQLEAVTIARREGLLE